MRAHFRRLEEAEYAEYMRDLMAMVMLVYRARGKLELPHLLDVMHGD